jgi:hypothetical protein
MDESTYIAERDRILEEIDTTFNGVSLRDGVGYYEAQTDTWSSDTKAISRARNRDRQSKRWQELGVDCEERLMEALAATDQDGFYFLFPAYMVLCIKQKYGGMEIADFLEYMRREQDPRINGFKEKQKHTIAHCLQFVSEVEEWTFSDYPEHHLAKTALKEYWGQFLK